MDGQVVSGVREVRQLVAGFEEEGEKECSRQGINYNESGGNNQGNVSSAVCLRGDGEYSSSQHACEREISKKKLVLQALHNENELAKQEGVAGDERPMPKF